MKIVLKLIRDYSSASLYGVMCHYC